MRCSVYIAVTQDGFIAREDGDVEWLEQYSQENEDYGYHDFMESVDVLILGRNTFEKVVNFGDWAYGDKTVVVMSSEHMILPPEVPETVRGVTLSPAALLKQLESEGKKHAYVDGGITIQSFLRDGLVDQLILSRVPILLGSGIPLFGELEEELELEHSETLTFDSGIVQSHYTVRPQS